MRMIVGAALALLSMAPASHAQDFGFLGFGYQVANDFVGDGHDRWRTGSAQASVMLGRDWNGRLAMQYFDTLELRASAEIVAPDNLDSPAKGDRSYAGVARFGVHSHFNEQLSDTDFDIGLGIEVIGPQTKLDELQANFHRMIGSSVASDSTRKGQIGDDLSAYGHIEAARTMELGESARAIPFVEGHAGLETYARIGADIEIGGLVQDELRVRDYTTGQTYTAIRGTSSALTLIAGADIGYTGSSALLPDNAGYDLVQERARVRSGLMWRGQQSAATFGLTYLSKEFDNQDEGQMLGSFNFTYKF
ncbi:lipid A deacylase LpxR family protein [Donghicola sp. C2-DW-16]|uniref:Lipid A deacylase LpxR family protein n=1 Tax=Donghicola mangrovi TaxID=2729614 RepID=A0ABX2PFE0_9RHOB|nr:lipid A-modifier LpxR family protein [Donghicola mangrovi]NVO28211.1 lipid A deacylase LpxR family protein [Donghicola mangrovi]